MLSLVGIERAFCFDTENKISFTSRFSVSLISNFLSFFFFFCSGSRRTGTLITLPSGLDPGSGFKPLCTQPSRIFWAPFAIR